MSGEGTAAIRLEDLWLGWPGNVALRAVQGRFEPGSLTALVGANGAGKSTLLQALAGRVKPLRGHVSVAAELQGRVAFLPQAPELDLGFPIRTFELVALGAWQRLGAWRGLGADVAAAVEDALRAVGLQGLGARLVGTLSGGQLRRALFARAMLRDARVLLLDEPFAAVDEATTQDLMALLLRWHAEGRTVVVALHDQDLVRRHFPTTLALADGRVRGWGASAAVLAAMGAPMQHAERDALPAAAGVAA